MKKTTIKILFIIVLTLPTMTVAAASQSVSQARETAGLYSNQANREAVQESSEKVGLYKDIKAVKDLKAFEEDPDDDSGDLRAGGDMGGGHANKVPVGGNCLIILLGAMLYAGLKIKSAVFERRHIG